MKFLNRYFFGEENISLHDFCWFYGTLGGAIILTAFVAATVLF